jgi:hypothetical protein
MRSKPLSETYLSKRRRPMANKTGDRVTFRGSHNEYRLIGSSPITGIVQYKDGDKIVTTSDTEIAYNYTEAARLRADRGIDNAEVLDAHLAESLQRGLEQSAKGETESMGSFVKYLEDEEQEEILKPGSHRVMPWTKVEEFDTLKADEDAHEEYYMGNPLGMSHYEDKYAPGYAADHTDKF